MMAWQYRTILFEFTKDGLLGDKYVDDEEVEKTLNELGAQGWELVNVVLLQDGLLAFLKLGFGARARLMREEPEADEAEEADDEVRTMAPPIRQPYKIIEREPVSDEEVQAEEREHCFNPGRQRQDALKKQEPDFFDYIRIS